MNGSGKISSPSSWPNLQFLMRHLTSHNCRSDSIYCNCCVSFTLENFSSPTNNMNANSIVLRRLENSISV